MKNDPWILTTGFYLAAALVAALSVLTSCVSADTRRELEYRRAEVATAEARLLELAPGDKRAQDMRSAVVDARAHLEKVCARANGVGPGASTP